MVLAGKTFWSWPRTNAISKWHLAWSAGRQPGIQKIRKILHMAVVTWRRWLLHTDVEEMVAVVAVAVLEIKDFVAMVEIAVSEETVKTEIATETVVLPMVAMALAMAMVAELTSTKTLAEARILRFMLLLIQINSQFLTLMVNLFSRRRSTIRRCNGVGTATVGQAPTTVVPMLTNQPSKATRWPGSP